MAGKVSSDPNVFILPDLGEGLEEAELIAWKVAEGDAVEEHQILAEMETDKALVEVPSPRTGTIATLHGEPGEIMKVGKPLVTYAGGKAAGSSNGASPAKTPTKEVARSVSDGPAPSPKPEEEREDAGTVVGNVGGQSFNAAPGKALATPAVRRLARDNGVDINTVRGTGIGGRVTRDDVEAAAKDGSVQAGGSKPQPGPAAQPAPQPTAHPQPAAAPSMAGFTQPQHPQPQQFQPQPQYQQGYPSQYPQQQPGMMAPWGVPMMLVPVPMPMPGMNQGSGIPAAPGYQPSTQRPVPDPAQRSQIHPGESTAKIPFRGVRRTIAERLRQSVDTAVHFTVMDEADVTAIDDIRRRFAQQTGEKVSFLPFLAVACCRVLSAHTAGRFGAMNATVDDQAGEVVQHAAVHLGIATDTDSGLMVPVVRDADRLGVVDMQRGITSVAAAARDRSATREQLMGSTFTISNVGSHAGKFATPVINYPEVAIIAAGRVYDAVVVRDGQPAVGKVMPLSLACDHRVVDGATAALALAEIVRLLQDPNQLI